MTRQRRAILQCVRQADTHPSADEVYQAVRQTLPRISLGTVYRTLSLLSELGLIRELDLVGQAKRFDGDLGDHSHIRCTECGQVADVTFPPDSSLDHAAQALTDYRIVSYHLEFTGVCPMCQALPHEALRENDGGPELQQRRDDADGDQHEKE